MSTAEGARPQLRPLALGEILDVSIKLCRTQWRTLLRIVLLIAVPVQIVSTVLTADYTASSFDFGADAEQTPEEAVDDFVGQLGGLAITLILGVVAGLLATAACFQAIGRAYLGRSSDWRSSLSYALQRFPALLLISLLSWLGVIGGTLVLIAPGVWLWVAWAFAIPVLLMEGTRGPGALGRSFRLVKGRWWRTFGVLALGYILASIVAGIAQGVFFAGILINPGNDLLVLVFITVGGIVGVAITTPFVAALVTVVYFDLRVRKEGFDIELLARQLGVGPLAPGPAESAPALAFGEEIDRTGAPYWPPPPGWKPPGSGAENGGGPGEDPPRQPGAPPG